MATDLNGIARIGETIRWVVKDREHAVTIGATLFKVLGVVQVYEVKPDDRLKLSQREVCLDGRWLTQDEVYAEVLELYGGNGAEELRRKWHDNSSRVGDGAPFSDEAVRVNELVEYDVEQLLGEFVDIDSYARSLTPRN